MANKKFIRNIGIFAHIDAGKTTLAERILYETGSISAAGRVEDGTTEMDTLPEEIARGISIISSTTQIKYKYLNDFYYINFIDTPGHLDFHSQVESALLAVDIAILLIDVTTGVRSQTEIILKKIQSSHIPFLIFINKIDIPGNDPEKCEKEIQSLIKIPLRKLYSMNNPGRPEYIFAGKSINEQLELPLIEWDNLLIDKYLTLGNKKDIIIEGMLNGAISFKFIPVFIGSALEGQGVKELMNFICMIPAHFPKKQKGELGIVFKRQIHPELGKIVFIKTWSDFKKGQTFYLKQKAYVLDKMYQMIPGDYIEIREVSAFNVFALNLDEAEVGDIITLENANILNRFHRHLSREFVVVIEPFHLDNKEALMDGLKKVTWEDHGLYYHKSKDSDQLQLWGSGELHLDVSLNRLKNFCKEIFTIGKLRVARYEKYKNLVKKVCFEHTAFEGKFSSGILTGQVEEEKSFLKQVVFENSEIPTEIQEAVRSGFYEVLSHGNYGEEILGISLKIFSYQKPGSFNDSAGSLVKVAIVAGIKTILAKNTYLVGPVSHFEISVNNSHLGIVLATLQKRNARIHNVESSSHDKTQVRGDALAENMLGFTSALRNMTQGRGTMSLNTVFAPDSYSYI